jgi:hypothetical protein
MHNPLESHALAWETWFAVWSVYANCFVNCAQIIGNTHHFMYTSALTGHTKPQ